MIVVPTGITSILCVTMSPFNVPYSLAFLVGTYVSIVIPMMKGPFWMILLPPVLGMICHEASKGKVKSSWSPRLSPSSKVALGYAVALNSSVIAPYVTDFSGAFVKIMMVVFVVAAVGYVLGWLAGVGGRWDPSVTITLTFNSGIPNISGGAVIARAFISRQRKNKIIENQAV